MRLPIEVSVEGIPMDVREVQLAKAVPPIEVTEEGMDIDSKEAQPQKAPLPREVTEEGITVLMQPAIKQFPSVNMIALQSPLLSYAGFPGSTSMDEREEQLAKAKASMEVTEEGMAIDLREVQPLKAPPPMEVTEEGISMETREEQSSKA